MRRNDSGLKLYSGHNRPELKVVECGKNIPDLIKDKLSLGGSIWSGIYTGR